MTKPLIMLTNDDGIEAAGLKALAEALEPIAELLVTAPSKQQSGMGRSFWSPKDDHFQTCDYVVNGNHVAAYHCDCTPAWIAHHALSALCREKKPDLVVSGINHGLNLGWDLTVSGTVGAALHAATFGVPALAMSLQTHWHIPDFDVSKVDWSAAQHFARFFAEKMLKNSLDFQVEFDVLNVNIPENATPSTPWKKTSQARSVYFNSILDEPTHKSLLRDARIIVDVDQKALTEDSDIHTIINKKEVSATPLHLDLTAR